MSRRLTGVLAAAAATLAAALAGPAYAALPPSVERVYDDFRSDGVISPCRHSTDALRRTRDSISPDIEQYAPDFPEAVSAAIEARARGDCEQQQGGTGGATTTPPPPIANPPATPLPPAPGAVAPPVTPPAAPPAGQPAVGEPPAPAAQPGTAGPAGPGQPDPALEQRAAASAASGAPALVWLLWLFGGLAAAAALVAAAMSRTPAGREHLAAFRHSWGEAGFRAGGTWLDFRDWVRQGR